MSVVSSALIWDHRGRTKKGCEGPLEYRITIDRKSWYVNTGVKVCRNEWKFGAVVNRADADVLNERLRILADKIEVEINRCISEGVAIDVAEIRRRVWSPLCGEKSNEMTEWMQQRIEAMNIARNTRRHYDVMIAKLNEAGLTMWKDATVENLKRWDEMLRGLKSKRYKQKDSDELANVGDATLACYHAKLKSMLKKAVSEGLITRNPYDVWQPDLKKVRYDMVDYLNEEELEIFRKYVPRTQGQRRSKDLFIVQCYTGMAYCDLSSIEKTAYRKIDDRWIGTSRRIKTGVPFVNVLLPPVVEILEKYNWTLPLVCLQTYDKNLADIGRDIGFDIRLRSHVARHTFATMMLRNGVKIENLARMLGHTNITQTQRYAKVLAQSVQEDFEMIEKKMFNK